LREENHRAQGERWKQASETYRSRDSPRLEERKACVRVMPGLLSISLQDVLHGIQPAVSREVKIATCDIHVFSISGLDLAYDGASGTLHRLDPVGREVLRWAQAHPSTLEHALAQPESPEPAPSGLLGDLSPRFLRADTEAAWAELSGLAGKTLFAQDSTITASLRDEEDVDPLEMGLKAMCLDVAHDCNLACAYCFASQGSFGGRPRLMTREGARAAVDFLIFASKGRKYLDVDFFGGEPLLAFDTVKEAVTYARQRGREHGKEFRFTLTTNCTLLDDDKLVFLNGEAISLILSVDGRPEVHDAMRRFRDGRTSHAAVLERAKRAVESRGGRDYYLRGTYTSRNLDFDADVRYLYEAGFRRLSLEPAVGEGEGEWGIREEDLRRMGQSYEALARFWADSARNEDPFEFYHFNLGLSGGLCRERRITGCGAGYEYVAVAPDGEVYPCHQLVGKQEYLLGTVSSGLTRLQLQRRFCQARVPHKEACAQCWARYLCGGGCHARSVLGGRDLTQPDPLSCRVMQTRLEYALYAQILRSSLAGNHRCRVE